MRLDRTAALVLATFGLTVALSGQAGVVPAPFPASEKQNVMGQLKVQSSAAGQTRIELWLNTPTYLAKRVELDADRFAISQEPSGAVLIEAASPVRVTGFALGQGIDNTAMLQNAEGSVLTWDQGFKLRILADGTPQWGCCPRK